MEMAEAKRGNHRRPLIFLRHPFSSRTLLMSFSRFYETIIVPVLKGKAQIADTSPQRRRQQPQPDKNMPPPIWGIIFRSYMLVSRRRSGLLELGPHILGLVLLGGRGHRSPAPDAGGGSYCCGRDHGLLLLVVGCGCCGWLVVAGVVY